jgi:glycosyltransferase involved in cell wall biosynthesis
MKPISVLIPTASQPQFLKTALQSVARQTAIGKIEEILVSENLMNRESERVCNHFKALPIRYIFQDPPLSKVQHFNYLYTQASADFVALLCDDDWWGPSHLESAFETLKHHTTAVAASSACLHVPGDSLWTGVVSRSPILWLLAGRRGVCETWCFSSHQLLAAAWIQTPFHISTLVIRRPVLQEVVAGLADFHSYQDDRMLQTYLGLLGMIVYEPLADTFVRSHQEALTWQFSAAERKNEFHKGTSVIQNLCKERGVDLLSIWKASLTGINGQTLDDVGMAFRKAMVKEQLCACGFEQFVLPNPVVRMFRRSKIIIRNRWNLYKPIAHKWCGLATRR